MEVLDKNKYMPDYTYPLKVLEDPNVKAVYVDEV